MDLVTNQTLIHCLHIDLNPIYVNRFALWIAPTHQQNRKPRKTLIPYIVALTIKINLRLLALVFGSGVVLSPTKTNYLER